MLLNINRPRQAFMNVVIAWAGDVHDALIRIANFCRPGSYWVDESGFPDDDAGPASDDSAAQSRTITWSDGRHVTQRWQLPSPGR